MQGKCCKFDCCCYLGFVKCSWWCHGWRGLCGEVCADAEELQSLHGSRSVVRLVLPPTRTLALVEFKEPQDAR
jgi:hypothetical protein